MRSGSESPVAVALSVLSLPEGPTNKELQRQARAYLKSLGKEDYAELRDEALRTRGGEEDEELQAYKYRLHKRIGFTDTEAHAYCPMRLNSPGLRRVIARRALLFKMKGWSRLPRGWTFYEVAREEDRLGLTKMHPDEIMGRLYGTRRRVKQRNTRSRED